jgi:hypothetical protein
VYDDTCGDHATSVLDMLATMCVLINSTVHTPTEAQQHRLAALQRLAALRTAWTAPLCPSLLLRAARHYESAAAAAVAHAVASAVPHSAVMQHPSLSAVTEVTVTGNDSADAVQRQPLAYGTVAVVQAPARVDLAGGWSDTPPICYEVYTTHQYDIYISVYVYTHLYDVMIT